MCGDNASTHDWLGPGKQACHVPMLFWDTEYKVWSRVKLHARHGEDCAKGFTEAGGQKGKRSEVKKPGAYLQPFQVSNSQDIYIKVFGRKYKCSLGQTQELNYHNRCNLEDRLIKPPINKWHISSKDAHLSGFSWQGTYKNIYMSIFGKFISQSHHFIS